MPPPPPLLLPWPHVQVSALIHTANRDYKSLIEDLVALEVLPKDTDRGQVRQRKSVKT